jgi:uncharacterized protein involved in outer membrane biogenesis
MRNLTMPGGASRGRVGDWIVEIMTKKTRIILVIASCVIVGAAVLLTLIPKTMDTSAYRQDVARWLTARLKRTVGIGGLEFSVITGPKIIMKDVVIDDDPSYSREPFLTAREVVVYLRIIPLLSGKLVVDGIKIRRPVVSIIERGDSSYNIANLAGDTAQTTSPIILKTSAFEAPVPSLTDEDRLVREIRVIDADVTYTRLAGDQAPEEIFRLKGVDAKIVNIRVVGSSEADPPTVAILPLCGDVAARVSTGFIDGMPFDDLKLVGKIRDNTLRAEEIDTELFGGRLSASGYIDLGREHNELVLNVTLTDVMANKLLSIFRKGKDSCFGVLNFEGTLTAQGRTAREMIDNLSGRGLVRVEDGHIPAFNIRTELTALGLISNNGITDILGTTFSIIGGSFVLSGDRLVTSKLAIKSEEWDAVGKGEVKLSGAVDFSGDIFLSNTMAVDIKPEYITSMLHNQTGRLSLPFNVAGDIEDPEFLLRPEFLTEKDAHEIFEEFKEEISEKYREGYSIKFINRLSF